MDKAQSDAEALRSALALVAVRLREAEGAEAAGDVAHARELRREALAVASLEAAPETTATQTRAPVDGEAGRSRASGVPAMTAAPAGLQAAVDRGHRLAKRPALRRDDVQKLLRDRSEAKRVLALAILQRRPDLGSVEVLSEAVAGSRGAFEHLQGLLAAQTALAAEVLSAEEAAVLREQLLHELATGRLDGTDRARVAQQALDS